MIVWLMPAAYNHHLQSQWQQHAVTLPAGATPAELGLGVGQLTFNMTLLKMTLTFADKALEVRSWKGGGGASSASSLSMTRTSANVKIGTASLLDSVSKRAAVSSNSY